MPLTLAESLALYAMAAMSVVVAMCVVLPWVLFNFARFERPVVLTTNDGPAWLGANCPESYSGGDIGGWSLLCIVGDPEYRLDEEPSA